MECKFNCWIEVFELLEIKVEPYWNVNTLVNSLFSDIKLIKVEPYWNVNYISPLSVKACTYIKVEPY